MSSIFRQIERRCNLRTLDTMRKKYPFKIVGKQGKRRASLVLKAGWYPFPGHNLSFETKFPFPRVSRKWQANRLNSHVSLGSGYRVRLFTHYTQSFRGKHTINCETGFGITTLLHPNRCRRVGKITRLSRENLVEIVLISVHCNDNFHPR